MSNIVYKVGDRVERIGWNNGGSIDIGKVYIIGEITNTSVKIAGEGYWSKGYMKRNFELIPNKNLIGGKLL